MKNTRNLTAALSAFGIGILALVALILLNGCVYTTVSDPETGKIVVRNVSPGWPWSDNAKTIAKLTVTAKTNAFSTSLNGFQENQTTTTNTTALFQAVVQGAVQGAAAALKP